MKNILKYKIYLVNWIKNEVEKSGMKGVIVGMSGGVDSSVVAALAKEAFPTNSLGVYMPINDMGNDLVDAKYVTDIINIKTTMVDLTKMYDAAIDSINLKNKLSIANIKPRLRMTTLYALAQEHRYLVLGTDNAAEWILGYFTKYGDGGVDLQPLYHLRKREVNAMAKIMGLPKIIYKKPPTAALWDGQTDEEELGFTYENIDDYLDGKKVPNDVLAKIKKQIKVTEHKRQPIPTPNKN